MEGLAEAKSLPDLILSVLLIRTYVIGLTPEIKNTKCHRYIMSWPRITRFFVYSFLLFIHTSSFQLLDKPWSQVSSFLSPGSSLHFFIAHRFQQSHCSSILHPMLLLTHALALSASQFARKKKSPRLDTSMHSGGFELTKLTYTRLEDNLIRHLGDRIVFC